MRGSRARHLGERCSGLAGLVGVGLDADVLAEERVDAPASVVEDVERARDLVLRARLDDLHDRRAELEDRVAQPAGGGVGGLADLLPRRALRGAAVGLGDALCSEREAPLAVDFLGRDEPLVLEELERRVDRAGAGRQTPPLRAWSSWIIS